MARRRMVAPPPAEPLPEHLARFTVADWVAPGEVPPHQPTLVNGQPPTAGYIAEAREILAWGRYRRALRLWQVEHLVVATTRG